MNHRYNDEAVSTIHSGATDFVSTNQLSSINRLLPLLMLQPLILASSSPRRRQLLTDWGYRFQVDPPSETAECGICSQETPPELVARLAYQKAHDVARRTASGVVIGCDTVAECRGQILGKPRHREHAREMLQLLSGRDHHVYSGLCLWERPGDQTRVEVEVTKLIMDRLSPEQLEAYLDSDLWEGKAGAFGYQDGLDWVHVVEGSETNVVGLPMELLARMLATFQPPAT
jgi:septum formation protein